MPCGEHCILDFLHLGVVMSIQDREWYAEEVLKKMGVIDRGAPAPPPGAGPFWISHRQQVAARRVRCAGWLRLLSWLLLLAVVAAVLFRVAVWYFKTSL